MLFVGFIAVFASAWCVFSKFTEDIKREKEEYSAIVALLLHIRGALSSGGGRLCDILRGFESAPLEDNGLLGVLRANNVGGLNDSKEFCETSRVFFRDNLSEIHLSVDEEDAKRLLTYLRGYGKSYLEEEKKKLSEITEHFSSVEKRFSEKSEKDIKAARTVFVFAFVGAFILLI